MSSLFSVLRRPLRRFLREDRGSVVAEAVIVLPVFLWAYLALFTYWDAFRSLNTVQKASYTVSDMVSREMLGISTSYVDGLDRMMEYLVDDGQNVSMRLTSVTWSATNNRFEVHWSRSPGNAMIPLTTTTLLPLASKIPTMAAGDYVVILEVLVPYAPTFSIGMNDMNFEEFIVTRPRFLPCLPLDNIICPVV